MGLLRFKYNPSSLLSYVGAAVAAFFLVTASLELWSFFQLGHKTAAVIEHWKVMEKSPSQYAIKASYTFEHQGKTYKGKTIFENPCHLNRLSAESQVRQFQKQPWSVWYQLSKPHHSTLCKEFPIKKSLYALMTLGVAVYFVSLRWRYQH